MWEKMGEALDAHVCSARLNVLLSSREETPGWTERWSWEKEPGGEVSGTALAKLPCDISAAVKTRKGYSWLLLTCWGRMSRRFLALSCK